MTILRELCEKNNIDETTTQDITLSAQTLIGQNYFRFRDTIYIQNEGLAMGAPTSSILSEVYFQHLESTTIYELLTKHKVESYFRYVDDILVIYKEDKTNIHMMLEDFNNLATSMKFTLEEERNNRFNFTDITITKNKEGLSFEIYRKPTATNFIIHNDSCHPREHKTTAIRYYYSRMETYQLTPENRKEKDSIRQILTNNKYNAYTLEKFNKKKEQRQNNQKQWWAKFTYVGKETRFMTKLFKNTKVKVASTIDNTIGKRLTINKKPPKTNMKKAVYIN